MTTDQRKVYTGGTSGPEAGQFALIVLIQVEADDPKSTRRSLAALYALCIAAFRADDVQAWQAINGHLRKKHDMRGLDAIKKLGWSIYEAAAAESRRRLTAVETAEVGHA